MKILEKLIKDGVKLTPMMEQFYSIKKNYPETLLLFRMGDFYELFFEDAKIAADVLNITLTHRGKIGGIPIPMSGIPHHAANTYIDRITSRGMKAAICEQIEDPKTAKGIVKRSVTRVVSPGMPYDLEKTEAKEHYYISSGIKTSEEKFYLVSIDFTTGNFIGHKLNSEKDFVEKIREIGPKEFISSMGQWDNYPLVNNILTDRDILVTNLSEEYFEEKFTTIHIETLLPKYKRDKIIKSEQEITGPLGALSYYICSTRPAEKLVHIHPFRFENQKGKMKTTASTLIGLEIIPQTKESYKQSLLGFFDKTKTAVGARKLKNVFQNPITDIAELNKKLELTELFIKENEALSSTREILEDVRDIDRIIAKISTGKVTGSDLLNLAKTVRAYLKTDKIVPHKIRKEFYLADLKKHLNRLAASIKKTINDEIGATLEKGNLIRLEVDQKRDDLAEIAFNISSKLLKLEDKYKKKTGIPKIRVKFNNVAGYFIELSKIHSNKVPDNFKRKQTLVNSERYETEELNKLEIEILSSKDRLLRVDREIFNNIVNQVSNESSNIRLLSEKLADIDILQSNAWIAIQEDLVKPKIIKGKKIFKAKEAWHPLIKNIIKDQFIAHDILLDETTYFGLITGPNMAGKTTVMREVAIIQLLSQIGSFVPARSVTVGVCDYLFSRLGASDDITKGQSTFMVEMSESAEILRHATENSLIILDEVGRGTSTYDGLSIAWALTETLISKIKSLTLFATHYHELIDVVTNLTGAKNLTVETINSGEDVQFLYRLIEGGASQSYGLYVAKLAGFPPDVLMRARDILKGLEGQGHNNKIKTVENPQLNFLETISMPQHVDQAAAKQLEKFQKELIEIDVMQTTPIAALKKLQDLQTLIH